MTLFRMIFLDAHRKNCNLWELECCNMSAPPVPCIEKIQVQVLHAPLGFLPDTISDSLSPPCLLPAKAETEYDKNQTATDFCHNLSLTDFCHNLSLLWHLCNIAGSTSKCLETWYTHGTAAVVTAYNKSNVLRWSASMACQEFYLLRARSLEKTKSTQGTGWWQMFSIVRTILGMMLHLLLLVCCKQVPDCVYWWCTTHLLYYSANCFLPPTEAESNQGQFARIIVDFKQTCQQLFHESRNWSP